MGCLVEVVDISLPGLGGDGINAVTIHVLGQRPPDVGRAVKFIPLVEIRVVLGHGGVRASGVDPVGVVDAVNRKRFSRVHTNGVLNLDGGHTVIPAVLYKAGNLQGTLEVDGIALEIGLIEKLNIDTVWQLDSRA